MQQRANVNFSINCRHCEEIPGRKWCWIFHAEVVEPNRQSGKQAHPYARNLYLLSGFVLQVGDHLGTVSVRVGKYERDHCAGEDNDAHHQNESDETTNSHDNPDRNKCVLPSLRHETSERTSHPRTLTPDVAPAPLSCGLQMQVLIESKVQTRLSREPHKNLINRSFGNLFGNAHPAWPKAAAVADYLLAFTCQPTMRHHFRSLPRLIHVRFHQKPHCQRAGRASVGKHVTTVRRASSQSMNIMNLWNDLERSRRRREDSGT